MGVQNDIKPRLWLHVGPSKTGTTSIQYALAKHNRQIRASGVVYPRLISSPIDRLRRISHHRFARAVLADNFEAVEACVENLPTAPDIIISTEDLTMVATKRPQQIVKLAELLSARYDTRVIYYARSPVDRFVSSIQHGLQTGVHTLQQARTMKVPFRKYSIKAHLEEFGAAFGPSNVVTREFSKSAFADRDLISDFCIAIGKQGLLDHAEHKAKNVSMTLESAEAIEAYRLKTGYQGRLDPSSRRFRNKGSTKFTLPDAVIEAASDLFKEDLDWLAETHGIDFR